MSIEHPRSEIQMTEISRSDATPVQYISVTEALKLISPFSGNKKEVLTFVSNVDTAFRCINPSNEDRLYQFVLTRISGEPRTAILHRNLESWEELKEFLRNTYTEKRTLDFHANQLFKARQERAESISEWIQKIQTLGSKFRESALQNCREEERAGILNLSDKLRNICFVQGLQSDRIQTIVRSRNNEHFDDIAEIALEEESAIVSKHERYRGETVTKLKCGNCGKTGHPSDKCFSKRNPRVSQVRLEKPEVRREIVCFKCNMKGHFARDCRKGIDTSHKRDYQRKRSENEEQTVGRQPTVSQLRSIGCLNTDTGNFIAMKLSISKQKELFFLLDTGADVSVLSSKKLIGETRFEPLQKVRLKSANGSIVETHGLVKAEIMEKDVSIPFNFQLVSHQLDMEGDGILGKDFLQEMRAQICYRNNTVTFNGERFNAKKTLLSKAQLEKEKGEHAVRTITLQKRSETIVKIPVDTEEYQKEGLLEKCELTDGVFVASSLTTVRDGYVLTSILNTNEQEVKIPEPKLTLNRVPEMSTATRVGEIQKVKDRRKEVLSKLRLEHLNEEERNMIENTCSDYQDVFYLPGEELSSTNAVKHSIKVLPGTAPINTRPYRLPEAQKIEIEKQVEKLVDEGIIEESHSPWNSPLLIVPRQMRVERKNGE
jgi:hypothetical protein